MRLFAPMLAAFGEPTGQGWDQIADLALALALSSLIGLEREVRQKSAGLRTHTIVGFASALIVLVSKYGFTDVLSPGRIVVDPSRVAAQIVSGIGFIGGGLIFVRRDAVRGLTTAAVVWLTAAVGMAAGAGLPVLALAVTAGHFLVVYALTPISRRLPRSRRAPLVLRLTYEDGRGVLRQSLEECTNRGFSVNDVAIQKSPPRVAWYGTEEGRHRREGGRHFGTGPEDGGDRLVAVNIEVAGPGSIAQLLSYLADIDGVVSVNTVDINGATE